MAKHNISNAEFLGAIFHDLPPNAAPVVAAFGGDPRTAVNRDWWTFPVIGAIPNVVARGKNQYFSIASVTPDPKGHYTRRHPAAVHALVVDDIGSNGKVDPECITLEPSWELETSPDNSQFGFILDQPITDFALFSRVLDALKAKGYTDPNGNNPVRLVRLPEGSNTKAETIELWGKPFECVLHIWEPNRRFPLADLIDGLGLELAQKTPENAEQAAQRGDTGISTNCTNSENPARFDHRRARKLAWDAARRTHDDPTLGRHAEIVRLGAYAARDGHPDDALDFILHEFAAQMRPTASTGQRAAINWEAEARAIRDGFQRGRTEPRKNGELSGHVAADNPISVPHGARPLLRLVDLSNLGSVKVPATEFVIPPYLPRGEVTLLGSHGGAGKTMLALLIAACLATGRRFGDSPIPPGRALVVSLEDPPSVVLHRLQRIAEDQAMAHDMITANVTVLDGSDADAPLAVERSEFGIRHLELAPALAEIDAQADDYDLVIIDNASDAFDADENSRRQVRGFIRALARIGRRAKAAVLLLAHIDKVAARYGSGKNSYSGSTAWHNTARSRLALTQEDTGLALVHEKSNLGRLADPLALEWSPSYVLVPIAPGAAEERHQRDMEAVVDAIAKANAANDIVPAVTTGKRTAHKALTPHLPGHLRTGAKTRVDALIERLARDGRIARASYKTQDRKTKEQWICANAPMCANGELFT